MKMAKKPESRLRFDDRYGRLPSMSDVTFKDATGQVIHPVIAIPAIPQVPVPRNQFFELTNAYSLPPLSEHNGQQGYLFRLTLPERLALIRAGKMLIDGLVVDYEQQWRSVDSREVERFVPFTPVYEPVSNLSVTSNVHIETANPEHHTVPSTYNLIYRFWPPVFPGQVVPPAYRSKCLRGDVELASVPLPTEPLTYPLAEEFLGQPGHIHEVNFPIAMLTMSETTRTLSGVERTYRDQEVAASYSPIYGWMPYTTNYGGPVIVNINDAPLNATVQLDPIQDQPETMMIQINNTGKKKFRYYPVPFQNQPIPECFKNAMGKIDPSLAMRTYMVGSKGRDQNYARDVEHGKGRSRSRAPIEVHPPGPQSSSVPDGPQLDYDMQRIHDDIHDTERSLDDETTTEDQPVLPRNQDADFWTNMSATSQPASSRQQPAVQHGQGTSGTVQGQPRSPTTRHSKRISEQQARNYNEVDDSSESEFEKDWLSDDKRPPGQMAEPQLDVEHADPSGLQAQPSRTRPPGPSSTSKAPIKKRKR